MKHSRKDVIATRVPLHFRTVLPHALSIECDIMAKVCAFAPTAA